MATMATIGFAGADKPEDAFRPHSMEINKESFTIGRHGDFKTPYHHTSVSRLHCAIFEDGGSYKIRDLNSFSGTVVNGELIGTKERGLSDGDKISLGNHVVLVFKEWIKD